MKKNYTKFLFATMMLLISSVGFAQTTFYIEPFTIAAGETKVIPVLMENPDDTFSQLQFDITLPEGLEIPEYFDEEQFDDVKDIKRGSRTKSVCPYKNELFPARLRGEQFLYTITA